jgi:hypothetical protein
VMVDRKCTRQYWCPFREFGECGEVHPSLADLDHLPLALDLIGWTGCLPLERFPRLRATLDEMGWASAVKTTIVALIDGRKARLRTLLLLLLRLRWKARLWTLLLLLLRLRCRWSVESCLLGWSSYPSARQIALRQGSRSSARNQPIP